MTSASIVQEISQVLTEVAVFYFLCLWLILNVKGWECLTKKKKASGFVFLYEEPLLSLLPTLTCTHTCALSIEFPSFYISNRNNNDNKKEKIRLTYATAVAFFQITSIYWLLFAAGIVEWIQAAKHGQLAPKVGSCQ